MSDDVPSTGHPASSGSRLAALTLSHDDGAQPRAVDMNRFCFLTGSHPARIDRSRRGRCVMGTGDKIDNKAEELKGKAKEAVGKATDDPELEAEGHADQAKGNLKQAGEKIKDVFKS